MLSCEPIMILMEDLAVIDGIIEKQYNDSKKDIFSRECRRELIAERKAVIHKIFSEWQEGQRKSPKSKE
jgi:hypothetical protein